jgi:hypothetical protein
VPAPGAIFLTLAHRHTGLVVDVLPGNRLATIEGNTNAGGSPEGDGVYARERRLSEIEIFLDFSKVDLATLGRELVS